MSALTTVLDEIRKLRRELESLKADPHPMISSLFKEQEALISSLFKEQKALRQELAELRQENRSTLASVNLQVAKLQVEVSEALLIPTKLHHLRENKTVEKRARDEEATSEGNEDETVADLPAKRQRQNEPEAKIVIPAMPDPIIIELEATATNTITNEVEAMTTNIEDLDEPIFLPCPKNRFRLATYDSPEPSTKSIQRVGLVSLPKITPETVEPVSLPKTTPETFPISPVSMIELSNGEPKIPITETAKSSQKSADDYHNELFITDDEEEGEETARLAVPPKKKKSRQIGSKEDGVIHRKYESKDNLQSRSPEVSPEFRTKSVTSDTSTISEFQRSVAEGQKPTSMELTIPSDSDTDSNDETVTPDRAPRILTKMSESNQRKYQLTAQRYPPYSISSLHYSFLPRAHDELKAFGPALGIRKIPEATLDFTWAELKHVLKPEEYVPHLYSCKSDKAGAHYLFVYESDFQPLLSRSPARHCLAITPVPVNAVSPHQSFWRSSQPVFMKYSDGKIQYIGNYTHSAPPTPLTKKEMDHFVGEESIDYWKSVMSRDSYYGKRYAEVPRFLLEELRGPRPSPQTSSLEEIKRWIEDGERMINGLRSSGYSSAFQVSEDGSHLSFYWQKMKAVRFDLEFYNGLVTSVQIFRKMNQESSSEEDSSDEDSSKEGSAKSLSAGSGCTPDPTSDDGEGSSMEGSPKSLTFNDDAESFPGLVPEEKRKGKLTADQ